MTGTRRDVREHNRIAWDARAEQGNEWTVPVSQEAPTFIATRALKGA